MAQARSWPGSRCRAIRRHRSKYTSEPTTFTRPAGRDARPRNRRPPEVNPESSAPTLTPTEHHRFGDLDDEADESVVWMERSRGAHLPRVCAIREGFVRSS